MNPGQEKFLGFIMDKVGDEHKADIENLLHGVFKKQNDGTATHDDIHSTQASILDKISPEMIEEVKGVMSNFASQMLNKSGSHQTTQAPASPASQPPTTGDPNAQ